MSNCKTIKETIHARGIDITIYTNDFKTEYISLTDIARFRSTDPRFTIHSWLRSRDIVEFLGLWECLYNPDFNRVDFDTFKRDAGTNAYAFSIKKWNDHLHGVGNISKSGRYGGGIFAQADIALEFASWLSPEFKLYIVKDYQRLKTDENSRLSLNWNLNREISKINYRIHTDAINGNLILPVVVGVHIGEDEDLLALEDVHKVVYAAHAASGQPVILRDESGTNEGRFLGLNHGHNPFRVAGEEMLAKQALYAFCS